MDPWTFRRVLARAAVVAVVSIGRAASAQTASPPAYRLMPLSPAEVRRLTAAERSLLEKLNRRDLEHLARLTDVIAPEAWLDDELAYSPLPQKWAWSQSYSKLLVVDVPSQLFGAYEGGRLVRWGPVSTGRAQSPTPAGFFHLTWRSKVRRSTENDEWLLKWYFNFINERGVSFHEFELPGRPASHACVRLLARDAKWIYDWGVEWRLNPDRRHVDTPGTPVVVVGEYEFSQPPPWLTLTWWQSPVALPADPRRR